MNSEKQGEVNLLEILNTLDFVIFTFNEKREIIFSNSTAKLQLKLSEDGIPIGAAEEDHFEFNEYYDEQGNKLVNYPNGSAIDMALQGKETHNQLLEHRNKKDHIHKWVSVDCVPVLNEEGNFKYGIIWYRDVSTRKSREDKLQFLIDSTGILSIHMDFEKRLYEKAKLTIPNLADWCSVEILQEDGTTKRIALIHRDPSKIKFLEEYERKYPIKPGTESSIQKVIRTNEAQFVPIVTSEMIMGAIDLTEEQKEDVLKLELSSMMSVPISVKGKVLGVLTLGYAESGRVYSIQDLNFFKEFAAHLSVVLENAQLYKEISKKEISKDAFLASLSHELRNPLAPIRTNLELLKLKNPDPLFQEEIGSIMHQFGHLSRLLNDLLESTRFTRGKIMLNIEPIEITRIVENVVKSVRPLFEQCNIKMHVNYPPKPLFISGDHTRIEQALSNILGNAIKFTPKNGDIWIEMIENAGTVTIKIKDTGIGMNQEDIQHIFEPYYQSVKDNKGNVGLGIGLYLVYQIISLHEGTVIAGSDGPGTGSEFIITLPLTRPTYESKQPEVQASEFSHSKIHKILVVDDNQAAADGMSRLLNALGWQADAVYSGPHAFTHMETNTVDLILLDIGMPDMDGYQVIKTIKSNSKYENLPIVALTGYGLEDDKTKAIEAGFVAHLTKPIGTKELKEILNSDVLF